MSWTEIGLVAAQAAHLAAVLSVSGALTFRALVSNVSSLSRLVGISLTVALAAGALMLLLQAAAFADTQDLRQAAAVLPAVLGDTRFGRLLLLRLALLVLAAVLACRRETPAALVAAASVMLQAAMGHATAEDQPVLVLDLALHILAAATWLGGLIPLLLALRSSDGIRAVHRFSLVALLCVAVIAYTAFAQVDAFAGGLAGLFGTDYGQVALVKMTLFAALLVTAVANRFVFTPKLEHSAESVRRLRRGVGIEIALGLAVVGAAATLASLPPGVHEQPVWPFAWRPTLVALAEPDLRHEIRGGLLVLGGAFALLVLALAFRRIRWPALGIAAAVTWFAVPHLRLLLVEAYPTSFYVSPTGFDAAGIARGSRLFANNCVSCHGAVGRGDGPKAASLPVPPADLTADHLWDHSDGELFWWLSHGMDGPEGGLVMPGFAATLDADERWALIDFIHALNAGASMHDSDHWSHPIRAPVFVASCVDGRNVALADLRGSVVRVVAGVPGPDVQDAGVTTLFLNARPTESKACVATAPDVWDAYGIVAGLQPEGLMGSRFLVDADGWLRGLVRPGAPPPSPAALASQIGDITDHPIGQAQSRRHVHAR